MPKRDQIIKKIPSWYHPLPHMVIPSILGIAIISICIYLISNLQWMSLLCIPPTIFILFGFEWLVHKYVLHERQPLLGQIYELHERSHHIIYTHEKMAINSWRELYYVLMPPYAILLVFGLIAPLAFGIGMIFSFNVACLIIITSMLFFLTYEWLHFSYHLPVTTFLGRNSLIRRLRRVHRAHHNPKMMKKYNFNVTVPVMDFVLGTYKKFEAE